MNKTVLIIDDDKDILGMVQIALESMEDQAILKDCNVTIEEIELLQPDLVLLDHMLPLTSGGDLCRQLKNREATMNMPVVLVSGVVNLSELANFCGADDFIEKPFGLDEFLEKLKRFLD